MTTDEISKLIPDEVVEAAAEWVCCESPCQHPDGDTCCAKGYRDQARAAIAVGLAAWKGAFEFRSAHANYGQCLALPLRQETDNG